MTKQTYLLGRFFFLTAIQKSLFKCKTEKRGMINRKNFTEVRLYAF